MEEKRMKYIGKFIMKQSVLADPSIYKLADQTRRINTLIMISACPTSFCVKSMVHIFPTT